MGEGIPLKTRKTMVDHSPSMSLKIEPGSEVLGPDGELCHEDYPSRLAVKKENYLGGFLDVPQHPYSWSKPKPYLRWVKLRCIVQKTEHRNPQDETPVTSKTTAVNVKPT